MVHQTKQQKRSLSHAEHVARRGYFCSGHVLVNSERQMRNLPTLQRSRSLDRMAQQHALHMAHECRLFASADSIQELREQMGRGPNTKVGQNVSQGSAIKKIHHVMMANKLEVEYAENVLGKGYTHVGFGSAKGEDGRIYMVQLFRGGGDDKRQKQVHNDCDLPGDSNRTTARNSSTTKRTPTDKTAKDEVTNEEDDREQPEDAKRANQEKEVRKDSKNNDNRQRFARLRNLRQQWR